MARVLILFAHPALEKSRVHRRLIAEAHAVGGITVNDLYELYPDFQIDVGREQELLLAHDTIVLQHPMYWYSTPAILKQWQDLVLEHGWAYGSRGKHLRGKTMMSLVTTGGAEAAYQHGGFNRYTVAELLTPIAQTARLCNMEYLPPYVIHGTHRMDDADIALAVQRYHRLLLALRDDRIDPALTHNAATLNTTLTELAEGGYGE